MWKKLLSLALQDEKIGKTIVYGIIGFFMAIVMFFTLIIGGVLSISENVFGYHKDDNVFQAAKEDVVKQFSIENDMSILQIKGTFLIHYDLLDSKKDIQRDAVKAFINAYLVKREGSKYRFKTQEELKETLKKELKFSDEDIDLILNGYSVFQGELIWPLPGYTYIISYHGKRTPPLPGLRAWHDGIDLPAPMGTPVYSAIDGKVILAGENGDYGYCIKIQKGNMVTMYAHNSRLLVNVGDTVTAGQKIAEVGSTGASTGSHLHFEVHVNGEIINPLKYFPDVKDGVND